MRKAIKVIYRKLGRTKAYGWAHHEDNVIEIDSRLRGKKELEILLHESTHVLFPELDEDEVIEVSIAYTKLLWSLGFRKVDNSNHERLQDGTK
jgi:hypothetical protein